MGTQTLKEEVLFVERRRTERTVADLYADIFVDGARIGGCIIRNVSSDGLGIEYSADTKLPGKFEIRSDYFSHPLPVLRKWAENGQAGVELHL